jgi:hypothetical protein
MLVVTRYQVLDADRTTFRDDALRALGVLVESHGCTGGHLGRSIDDPTLWTLTTTWDSVGSYRRALSRYDVKLVAVPLMYRAIDEPTAFEELATWTPTEGLAEYASDRADEHADEHADHPVDN